MNIEAIKELSDAISFVMVTPEFLREQRLQSFRQTLINVLRRLVSVFLDSDEKIRKRPYYVWVLFGGAVQIAILWSFKATMLGLLALYAIWMLPILVAYLIMFVHFISYRGFYFIAGAGLFLTTRSIAILYA
jgi:hypothetical protein